ncbi:MAG: tandem-95 repeat protein [Oceanospirillaceae bacterium]|nr:tandem-95 repeat protein [Oceanospirillaceae bacterium]
MNIKRNAPLAGCLVSLMLACGSPSEAAQGGQPGFYGDVDNLPPGRLKTQIEKLPYAAQQRAIQWLEQFNVPTLDFEFLHVDPEGGVYYEDTVLPDEVGGDSGGAVGEPQAVTPEDTFILHSRPGASKVVFLDFDGHVISGTAWNSGGASSYFARPYDTDGNPTGFSDSERAKIAEIWHRVSEDMAPFDIDVTTEDPGAFGPTTGHVLITSDTDETGTPMPHQNAGGVAYVNVWGTSYYTDYQPALVYYDNLGGGHPPYVSEAASHEFGHNLGLGHDGTSTAGYYSGHGSGYVSWAPIMGVGYYTNVTQWSKGEYPDASNNQDDVAIIGSKLGVRADDHSNGLSGATPLNVDPNGILYVTFPEIDPHNLDPANKGVIETRGDVDFFWFDTAEGYVSFNVIPAWEAFQRSSLRGANLDIEVSLYDALGNLVTRVDPLDETIAQIQGAYLAAGRYYLAVTGVGNDISPYSDYGSLGMYFISGTVQPVSADPTPPEPDPTGWWASVPYAQSSSQIDMAANPATDDSGGPVQYYFQRVVGACADSGWQSATAYSVTGLQPESFCSFHVKARDLSGNETAYSSTLGATTLANQAPVAMDDSAVTDEGQAVVIAVLNNDSDPDNGALTIAAYGQGSNGSVAQSGDSLVYTPAPGFFGVDSFTYTVTDGYDISLPALVAVTVNEVNQPPVAQPDSADVALNSSLTIDVLANDTDPDGDNLSIGSFSQGNKGSVALSAGGDQLVYTSGNKRGGDSFTYTVIDEHGNSSTTTVSINISPSGSSDGGGDTGSGGGNCHPKKGC